MPTAFSRRSLLAAGLSLGLLAAGSAQAADWCASKPVKFAGVNWESGMLLTELMGFVLQHGYDCKVDSIPGNSITPWNRRWPMTTSRCSPRSGSAAARPGTRPPRLAR
ncbi:hypothetical protein Q3H58_005057 [Pseudomonas psychrotolerans]|nr:hypothetical protein [Pseudomonas psychrotolerans]